MDLENQIFEKTLNEIRTEIYRVGKLKTDNIENAEGYMAGLAKAVAILANNYAVAISEKIYMICNNLEKELNHGRE